MKRKTVLALLAGVLTSVTVAGGTLGGVVYAQTWGSSWEGKNGVIYRYVTEAGNSAAVSDEADAVEAQAEEAPVLSEEEQKRLEQWGRVELQESLAYLKEYGVTYDTEQDTIWYQGKKVRWLIDNQIDQSCVAYQMSEGETDVYTVRNADYVLTGVREATKEEFDQKTEQEKLAEKSLAQDGVLIQGFSGYVEGASDETVTYTYQVDDGVVMSFAQAQELPENEIMITAKASDAIGQETEISITADVEEQGAAHTMEAEAIGSDFYPEEKKRQEEYKAVGIEYDDNGAWLWNGKRIYWLVDENGSMYQNGSASKDKIYVLVKRDEDGKILEAKQISVEEVIAAHILEKEAQAETNR